MLKTVTTLALAATIVVVGGLALAKLVGPYFAVLIVFMIMASIAPRS